MMTVHEVSKMSGVSIRALHHYDKIGLLPATKVTDAGYRLYDDTALERLQHILLFKELEFSLKEIKDILDSLDFDRSKALEQQIHLLELRKEHIQNLIDLAWGKTDTYKEYEQKSAGRSKEEQQTINVKMMGIFAEFGRIKNQSPDSEEAVALAKKLQEFITEHFYTCTDEILLGLGAMYAGGGDFTTNIDKTGGEGTAVFADQAIQAYCRK